MKTVTGQGQVDEPQFPFVLPRLFVGLSPVIVFFLFIYCFQRLSTTFAVFFFIFC
jgi:hypothetical protein